MTEYAEYLQTPAWRERRAERLRFAGHRCEVCNAGGRLEVHHRTYERLGRELMTDLVALCRECHRLFSDRMPKPLPAPRPTATDALVEAIRAAEQAGDGAEVSRLVGEKMQRMAARLGREGPVMAGAPPRGADEREAAR